MTPEEAFQRGLDAGAELAHDIRREQDQRQRTEGEAKRAAQAAALDAMIAALSAIIDHAEFRQIGRPSAGMTLAYDDMHAGKVALLAWEAANERMV